MVCERKPVLYVAFDIEARGALATVAPSRGLLGARSTAGAGQGSAQAARGCDCRSAMMPSHACAIALAAPLVADNALAPCLPFFESLAWGQSTVRVAVERTRVVARTHWNVDRTRDHEDGICSMQPQHDVVIPGGGLAGLTLALHAAQVRSTSTCWCSSGAAIRCRTRRTRSASRRSRSARNYLDTVLGLKDHLTGAAEEVRLPLLLVGRPARHRRR